MSYQYKYLSVGEAQEVTRRIRIISEYRPDLSSARCPLCGEWGNSIHKCVKKMKSGKLRRYFVCPSCGYKYSAE